MYGVDTPEDFADRIQDESEYWPDSVPRPENVEVHPQGQVYVRFDGETGETPSTALYVIRKAESCGLRTIIDSAHSLTITNPRPTCEFEGCYADAKGSKPYRDLCPNHAREAKHEKPAGIRTPEYYNRENGGN